MVYRQGDVVLVPVDALPKSAQATKMGLSIVLALGEVTGHSHTITVRPGVREYKDGGITYLTVDELLAEGVSVEHQEHAAVVLPPGSYRVTIQREWSDALDSRAVQD